MAARHLQQLREAIRSIEGGWQGADSGACHEWFHDGGPAPPLAIFLGLARQRAAGGAVAWIGRRVWPFPQALARAELLERSVLVDPPDDGSRLWAIDLAARSAAAPMVIADGSGLDMAATRRLQLAAEAGSALLMCARPPAELKRPSAAAARWLVRCAPSRDGNPRWIVDLLRCKGVQPESVFRTPAGLEGRAGRRWMLEWKRAQGGVVVSAVLVDRPGQAPPQETVRPAPARRTA